MPTIMFTPRVLDWIRRPCLKAGIVCAISRHISIYSCDKHAVNSHSCSNHYRYYRVGQKSKPVGWANYISPGCKFPVLYTCQKLWKWAGSRQSYCTAKISRLTSLAHPVGPISKALMKNIPENIEWAHWTVNMLPSSRLEGLGSVVNSSSDRECLLRAVTHVCVLTAIFTRYLYAFCFILYCYHWATLAVNNDDGSNWLLVCVNYATWLVFFLVHVTFWQIIHCSLLKKTNEKCVLWQRNRTMPL